MHYQIFDAFDIETDNLYEGVTRLWCSSHIDVDSGCVTEYRPECNQSVGEHLLRCKRDGIVVVGHNIVDFDLPAIEKVLGVDLDGIAFIDTLVVSRALEPDLEGGHSLKMWGKRLGILKGTYGEDEGETAWDKFSEEMMEYCTQDVKVTVALVKYLLEKLAGIPREQWYKVVQIYNSPLKGKRS